MESDIGAIWAYMALIGGVSLLIIYIVGPARRASVIAQGKDSLNHLVEPASSPALVGNGREPTKSVIELAEDSVLPFEEDHRGGFRRGTAAQLTSWLAVLIAVFFVGVAIVTSMSGSLLMLWLVSGALLASFVGAASLMVEAEHKRRMQAALERLTGPYVLYLRPFKFDLSSKVHHNTVRAGMFNRQKSSVGLEEALGGICVGARLGLRAIGVFDGYGLSKYQSDDANWQHLAAQMIREAVLIIVVPASSPGSKWELEEIIRAKAMDRTFWLMPPASATTDHEVADRWAEVSTVCRSELGLPFPRYIEQGAVFDYASGANADPRIVMRGFSLALLAACAQHGSAG